MGWKPKHSPSFLKFLLHPDFADNLPIPPFFVKKHLDGAGLENPILATCESGKTWAVTIVRMDGTGRRYCFKQGWPEFVKDNCLEAGDFLLFWLLGDSTFLVAIYNPTGIEKSGATPAVNRRTNFPTGSLQYHHQAVIQIDSTSETSGGGEDKDGKEKEERVDMHQLNASVNTRHTPSFEKLISNSNNYWMHLPISFVREAKILGSMRSIMLTDAEGMEWPVKITQRGFFRGFDLTEGWSSFRKANNIQNGDTCLFLFLRKEGNMIHVKVLIQKGTKRTGRGQNEGKYKEAGIIETASSVKQLHAPWFVGTLSRSSYYRMGLPIWFARETSLASRKYTVLKDAAGRVFSVSIKQRHNSFGYDLTTGWSRFRQENDIDKGDTCLFQFIHGKDNFIRVNVLKRKARSRFVKPRNRQGRGRLRLE